MDSPLLSESLRDSVSRHGFGIVPSALDEATRCDLLSRLGMSAEAGRRGMLAHAAVARLACSEWLLNLVRPFLPRGYARPVRGIFFDKSSEANWLVAWHQDLTLAVKARHEVAGFGPWSVKDGVPHVQPPSELLEQMLTVRLHLDDADESNGALRVLPGSHATGRLSSEEIQAWRERQAEHLCTARAGDALLMRPLLLHASGKSVSPARRRVLHLEYAGFDLPTGLEWQEVAAQWQS